MSIAKTIRAACSAFVRCLILAAFLASGTHQRAVIHLQNCASCAGDHAVSPRKGR